MRCADLLRQDHPFRQWKSLSLPGSNLHVAGYSKAKDKTFFTVPAMSVGLDAGFSEDLQPDFVFLTHTHLDHVASIGSFARKPSGCKIFVPQEACEAVQEFIQIQCKLNGDDLVLKHTLQPVQADVTYTFHQKYQVRVVQCFHRIPCVGYAFSERRTKLKSELEVIRTQMDPKEFNSWVIAQKQAGLEINHVTSQPLFVYLGDTTTEVFEHSPWLFEYPVIFIECTFLKASDKDKAKNHQHVHWGDLEPYVRNNPDTTFVLTHFSLRYSPKQIIEFFQPLDLPNIILWENEGSLIEESFSRL